MESYFLDLVSQCLPHGVALLWALLCVCGASVVHSHPRDRLGKRKGEYTYLTNRFTSHYLLVSSHYFNPNVHRLAELTAVVLDVVDSNVGGYK